MTDTKKIEQALLIAIALISFGSFGALFIWAWLKGDFKNVEKPKTRILTLEDEKGVRL